MPHTPSFQMEITGIIIIFIFFLYIKYII